MPHLSPFCSKKERRGKKRVYLKATIPRIIPTIATAMIMNGNMDPRLNPEYVELVTFGMWC